MALYVLRKPFAKLKSLKDPPGLSKSLYTNGDKANGTVVVNGAPKEHVAKDIAEERRKRSESRRRKSAQNKNRDATSRRIDPKFLEVGEEVGVDLYKPFSMNMSKRREHGDRILFKNLDMISERSFLVSSRCPVLVFMSNALTFALISIS
jgi:hypothetical protein